jgi:hypothetical protein
LEWLNDTAAAATAADQGGRTSGNSLATLDAAGRCRVLCAGEAHGDAAGASPFYEAGHAALDVFHFIFGKWSGVHHVFWCFVNKKIRIIKDKE